jgi:hypothetical protein
MRQGQQKRMRGRSRGGKGPNPLSRSYESNGPDVKVRGTAATIAEKYVQLARDAQSSGDPILAESYLQHAEHYFRVIAAAQPQFGPQQGYVSDDEEEGDDSEFEGPIPSMPQGYGAPSNQSGFDEQPRLVQPARERNFADRGEGEQPYREQRFRDRNDRFNGERAPREDRQPRDDRPLRDDRPPREDRPYRNERNFEGPPAPFAGEAENAGEQRSFNPRHGRRDRRFGDRPERPYRERSNDGPQPYGERQAGERASGERAPYQERSFPPAPVVPVDQPQPEIQEDNALSTLPSFITGAPPVAPAPAPAPVADAAPIEGEGEARFPLRTRRRRVTKRTETSETPETNPEPAGE